MTAEQIVKHFGSVKAALEALPGSTLTRDSYYKWKKQGRVPQLRQMQYEQLTDGALKADPA